jgi:Spy/CpxP family protein refolding chaperone
MNRFVTGIAVAATLLLAQGCSLSPRAEEKSATAAKMQQEEHSMGGMDRGGHSMSNTRDGEAVLAHNYLLIKMCEYLG